MVVSCCLCLLFGSAALASPEGKEIEARRRSLDKNFMRFGRTYPNPHMLYHLATEAALAEDAKGPDREMSKRNSNNKETRAPVQKGSGFLRFGRAGNSFLRFGRNNLNPEINVLDDEATGVLLNRPQTRATNSFLRFGKRQPFVPAEAIWPLLQQQQEMEQEDGYLDEANEGLLEN